MSVRRSACCNYDTYTPLPVIDFSYKPYLHKYVYDLHVKLHQYTGYHVYANIHKYTFTVRNYTQMKNNEIISFLLLPVAINNNLREKHNLEGYT